MSAGAGFTSRPSPDFRSTAIVGFRSPRSGGSPKAVRRPPVLDDLGLVAAVEWYVQDFATRAGLAHELHVGVDELTLDGDRAASVFRILQEALTNVARHAEATRVAVSLATSDEALTLTVEDDGTGISEQALKNGASLGLLGMRERAHSLRGQIVLRRLGRSGTVLALTIPLVVRAGAAPKRWASSAGG